MKTLIAGGTSGIGLATAQILAQQGATVIITGRDEQKMQSALATLPASAQGFSLDAADAAGMKSMMEKLGNIDHIVLALGGSKGIGLFKDLDLEVLREGFQTKLFPQLQTLQIALPYINSGGSITFISAVSAHASFPGVAGLAAINGAIESVVPILAKELQPLRVNAVSPGAIDTPWWNFMPEETRKDALQQYGASTLAGRIGKPEDVAQLIRQLVCNTYITGQVITIDGGLAL
ncbi:SDR family oxidoreductase [Chitinophagaceae bacterium MMS25-I14]